MSNFKVDDQVIVRRKLRTYPSTNEIKVGTITSLSVDGKQATVSISAQGGAVTRETVPVASLESVKSRFGRAKVATNPVHRQIGQM